MVLLMHMIAIGMHRAFRGQVMVLPQACCMSASSFSVPPVCPEPLPT